MKELGRFAETHSSKNGRIDDAQGAICDWFGRDGGIRRRERCSQR
jgi:hypothetical protein